ncbi:MAG: hypothetical protein ACREF7_00680, partial [Candidatus Saccharimonadales bacterium]
LAIVCAPEPVGTTSTFTVPLVVKRLMTELIFELMVVLAVNAETIAVENAANNMLIAISNTSLRRLKSN